MAVSRTVVRALLNAAEAAGHPTEFDLQDDTSEAQELELWTRLLAVVPDLGFQAATAWTKGQFRVLEYLMRTAPTMQDSLDELVRFNRVLHGSAIFDGGLDPDSNRYTVRFLTPHPDHAPVAAAGAEFALLSLFRFGCDATDADLEIAELLFRHAAPAHADALETAFRRKPVFDAETDAISFGPPALERALEQRDPVLHEILEEVLQSELRSQPRTDLLRLVRTHTAALLRHAEPKLADVAKVIGLSQRTLQSRLEGEGTTFRAELESLRESLARGYLRTSDLDVSEIAALLSYSEESSFRRAFKRWTGRTPAQYRKQVRSP